MKFDGEFEAVFHNSLPYPIDFYAVDFEGRKHHYFKKVLPGYKITQTTFLTVPWVFKRASDSKQLLAFSGRINASIFRGDSFDAKNNSIRHVTIGDGGNSHCIIKQIKHRNYN